MKKYVYSIFQLDDLKYLVEKKIVPKGVHIRVKENQEMVTKVRLYALKHNIPVYDSSDGELSYKGSEIRREVENGVENFHLDLSECRIQDDQLDFYEMASLLSIRLPTTVTFLPNYCFMGCINLREIYLPDGVKKIGKGCFFACQSLQTIRLPTTIHEYPEKAFGQCISLKNITYNQEGIHPITSLGSYCFGNCYSLTYIDLSNKELKQIPKYCFMNCYKLTQVMLSSTLRSIGERSFKNCGLENCLFLPGTIIKFGKEAFMGCNIMKSLRIFDGVTNISERCFYGCGLVEIRLPETVVQIGKDAFSNCTHLMCVEGMKDVKKFYKSAFLNTPIFQQMLKEEEQVTKMKIIEKQRELELEETKKRLEE